MAAQISVVTGAGPVPADLASFVAGVTVDDFTIGYADGAQDLVAVAVAP